jgi:TonB family protein
MLLVRRATFAAGCTAFFLFLGMPAVAQLQGFHPSGDSKAQEPLPDGVYRVGHGVKPPKPISTPDPEFSEQARRVGYEAVCVLSLIVGADGLPRDITVKRAAGLGLDEKALEAVQQWTFQPALKDGEPVAVQIAVETNFHLYNNGEKKPTLVDKANAGDAKAQFELAQMLLADPYLAKDDSKGYGYLEKAAKQNFSPAQFGMGEYFSSHKDDLVSAYVWYSLAQKNRYKESDERLKDLAAKMTSEQLAEARQRVDRSIEIRN